MKLFFSCLTVAVILFVGIMGFRGTHESRPWQWLNEMDQQQKVTYQAGSHFFADGRASRQPIPGTVPTVVPVNNQYLLTGSMGVGADGAVIWGDGIPIPTTTALIRRGQERYTINCAVCHGNVGNGQGITSKYGLAGAANLLLDNYQKMADGEIFNTIGNGKGQMMGYAANIPPTDRWAIVCYIRALQRSQNASLQDVPPEARAKLETP